MIGDGRFRSFLLLQCDVSIVGFSYLAFLLYSILSWFYKQRKELKYSSMFVFGGPKR